MYLIKLYNFVLNICSQTTLVTSEAPGRTNTGTNNIRTYCTVQEADLLHTLG